MKTLAVELAPFHEQLLLVGLSPRDVAVEHWQRLGPTFDVATLTDRRATKLLPLVWRALVDAGVDDPQLPDLEAIVHRTRAANELLLEQLRSALEVLHTAGVQTMGLKGVPLVVSHYRDWGLRPMSDADVLVHPEDAETTIAALSESGWQATRELPDEYVGRAEAPFVSPEHGCLVDVHWRLSPWVTRSTDGRDPAMWAASTPIDVLGQEMLAPAPHDLALHVVTHAFRSEWERVVRWVPDLVLLLRSSGAAFDWDAFVQRVMTGHLILPVREALEYVTTTFDAPVPPPVMGELRAFRPSRREVHKHRLASARVTETHRFLGQWPRLRTRWARASVNYTRTRAMRSLPAYLRARTGMDHVTLWPFVAVGRRLRRLRALRRRGSRGGELGDGAGERP